MPSNNHIQQVNAQAADLFDFSELELVDTINDPPAHWRLKEDRSGAMPLPCEGDRLECMEDAKWIIQEENSGIVDWLCVGHVFKELGPNGHFKIIGGSISVRICNHVGGAL